MFSLDQHPRDIRPSGESIDRVSRLWHIECGRLLGRLSRSEYRQALAVLHAPAVRAIRPTTAKDNQQ